MDLEFQTRSVQALYYVWEGSAVPVSMCEYFFPFPTSYLQLVWGK